jgi:ATP/maltotriose-dependent transcriptional regulator MalT
MALVGMAGVLSERGQLQTALDNATEGVGLCRQLAYALPLVAGLATLARIRQAQGDRAGALEAIAEAERVNLNPAMVGLFNPVPARRAQLALAHGEVAEAARWVQDCGLGPDDEPSYPREREYLVLARVLLAQHAPDRAFVLLERLHRLAVAHRRTGSVIEVRVLQALARAGVGDEPGGLAALAEALTLGAPEGYLRVLVDEGAPMATLLGKLLATPAATRARAGLQVPPASSTSSAQRTASRQSPGRGSSGSWGRATPSTRSCTWTRWGEVDYAPGEPKGTPWHPHRGFETVTYMIDGVFRHQDSNGGGGFITDGDTQWMTAGQDCQFASR